MRKVPIQMRRGRARLPRKYAKREDVLANKFENFEMIVDGGSGLNKALNEKYLCNYKSRRRAVRIRCHVHKWRNIKKALGDDSHKTQGLFWVIRDAKTSQRQRY